MSVLDQGRFRLGVFITLRLRNHYWLATPLGREVEDARLCWRLAALCSIDGAGRQKFRVGLECGVLRFARPSVHHRSCQE